MGVSHFIPQSGLSPVLTQYKKYLQSCYNARVLASADKYLPTLESPYINLAMIRRGHYNHEQRDEFTRRTLHGGVDQILENKTPINIEDLLTPEDTDERYQMRIKASESEKSTVSMTIENYECLSDPSSKLPQGFHPLSKFLGDIGTHTDCSGEIHVTKRAVSQTAESSRKPVSFILVEGPPGIGKSTFAWEVCRRWDEIEHLRDYHTVVLLKLREKWVLNATSLSDLLRFPSHPDFSNSIAEELVKSQGEKVLFVLDGFDEVSHSFHENSVIKSILCRQLLPECTIILTTRPVAKATLRSICQPLVDKHVEIIGFTEEERVRYITEVFSKEPELQVNFLKYMFLVPHIKSMMYIPLNCAIIAQVYYESQSSHHLAIPRTRTQLYKALTHSLLVRHMKMKVSNWDDTSMLPEGLDEENMAKFKNMAKFAFHSYHDLGYNKGDYPRKVTFFKEDIPEGLVHYGFMNESTEMYASKGVEQTFSFLHLSLQEYLAAWHLADSYSVQFQVAYHRLAVESLYLHVLDSLHHMQFKQTMTEYYEGDNKEEEALILSLKQQRSLSLDEPAIFLAGITGWRCQSEDDRNHWETYVNHHTVVIGNDSVFLQSLYEAQNPTLLPHYFTLCDDSRRTFFIGTSQDHAIPGMNSNPNTPYDCYALSYCLANCSDQHCYFLTFGFNYDTDIPLVETFVKGLNDHCLSNTPRVKHLEIEASSPSLVDRGLPWLMKANFLATVEECVLHTSIINNSSAKTFLQSLVNLKSLKIHDTLPEFGFVYASFTPLTSWEPIAAALKSMSELKTLHISITEASSLPPADLLCWLVEYRLTDVGLYIELPSDTILCDFHSGTHVLVDSVLKSVLRSDQITSVALSNISHETMAGVNNILLHCPSLSTLELKRTRLGYDGILYLCSALRNNTSLRHFMVHENIQLEKSRENDIYPEKNISTELLLQLCSIVKDNLLEVMDIESDPSFTAKDEEGMIFALQVHDISSDTAYNVIQTLVKMNVIKRNVENYKWLAAPESLKHLQKLNICNKSECDSQVNLLDIEFPMTTIIFPDICIAVTKTVDSLLKIVAFAKVALSNISRETMAGVHSILLHCPNITTLELKRTRLGYDGILYICSALRNNITLTHLVIHDDLQLPSSRKRRECDDSHFTTFSFMESIPLPGKTTCTDFLLELNNILKDNTTLEEIKVQSRLFLPLSAGEDGEYCQWTGLGPLQQFNVGAVGSGMSPNLRRSFSSSDLTQPQTTLFWDRQFNFACDSAYKRAVDFKKLFLKMKEKGKKLFSLSSFTASDTEVLQSFSGLDPRLKECLEISHLNDFVNRLRRTYGGLLVDVNFTNTYVAQPHPFQMLD